MLSFSEASLQTKLVDYADFLLSRGVKVLRGSGDLLHPYERLVFGCYLRDLLRKYGFCDRADVLDDLLDGEISRVYGEHSSVPKEQKPKGGVGENCEFLQFYFEERRFSPDRRLNDE